MLATCNRRRRLSSQRGGNGPLEIDDGRVPCRPSPTRTRPDARDRLGTRPAPETDRAPAGVSGGTPAAIRSSRFSRSVVAGVHRQPIEISAPDRGGVEGPRAWSAPVDGGPDRRRCGHPGDQDHQHRHCGEAQQRDHDQGQVCRFVLSDQPSAEGRQRWDRIPAIRPRGSTPRPMCGRRYLGTAILRTGASKVPGTYPTVRRAGNTERAQHDDQGAPDLFAKTSLRVEQQVVDGIGARLAAHRYHGCR